MKIYVYETKLSSMFLMEELLKNTFKDLGYYTTDIESADVLVGVLSLPIDVKIKYPDKKVVLLQTEPYKIRENYQIDRAKYGDYPYHRYKADAYWGFDKDDENESYLILGYHPSLDFTSKGYVDIKYPLGFIGCQTERRRKAFASSKYKITSLNTWDIEQGIFSSKRCKINVHINAWDKGETLTPWDRITRYLHNKCFFIMEDVCDCPIDQIVRFDLPDYASVVDKYIDKDKLRKEIAEECYQIYKKDFDMRFILQKKLDELNSG